MEDVTAAWSPRGASQAAFVGEPDRPGSVRLLVGGMSSAGAHATPNNPEGGSSYDLAPASDSAGSEAANSIADGRCQFPACERGAASADLAHKDFGRRCVGSYVPPPEVGRLLGDDPCAICLEPLRSRAQTITLCGHVFHRSCLEAARTQICPQCRQPIDLPDEEEVLVNSEGAQMRLGVDRFTYYCGRRLGVERIPNSDGCCGPDEGPQCDACYRVQLQLLEAAGTLLVGNTSGDFHLASAFGAMDLSATAFAASLAARGVRNHANTHLYFGSPVSALDWPTQSLSASLLTSVRPHTDSYVPAPFHEPAVGQYANYVQPPASLSPGGEWGATGHVSLTEVPRALPSSLAGRLELCVGGPGLAGNATRVLGSGAYAVVCEVRDRVTWEPRALKVVAGQPVAARGLLDQVRSEMAVQVGLRHPNIARLFEALEAEDDHFYFVFEYAALGSLERHIASLPQHRLALPEAARFVWQIADAVAYLHSDAVRLLHRDIKASNVLLFSESHVKLTDFGWSVRFSDHELPVGHAGTTSHMAPEVIMGHPHGIGADYWSIGVFLHEVAVGSLPFSTVEAACHAELQLPAWLPAPACDLVFRLLRVDPARRARAEDVLTHAFFEAAAEFRVSAPASVEGTRAGAVAQAHSLGGAPVAPAVIRLMSYGGTATTAPPPALAAAIAGASACSREPGDAGPWRIATNAAPASSASASWRLAPLFDRGGHCNSGRSAKCSHCAAIAGCREKRALALQSALAPYTARGQRRFHNPLAPRATWDPHEQPGCCANGRDEELGAEHKQQAQGSFVPPGGNQHAWRMSSVALRPRAAARSASVSSWVPAPSAASRFQADALHPPASQQQNQRRQSSSTVGSWEALPIPRPAHAPVPAAAESLRSPRQQQHLPGLHSSQPQQPQPQQPQPQQQQPQQQQQQQQQPPPHLHPQPQPQLQQAQQALPQPPQSPQWHQASMRGFQWRAQVQPRLHPQFHVLQQWRVPQQPPAVGSLATNVANSGTQHFARDVGFSGQPHAALYGLRACSDARIPIGVQVARAAGA
eukprot:CAMPEP_0117511070 /NCGR_PEP_ID=MMETSP0784-20121206/28317_1 /TAXON_ID=39447 /ORGANISM="" /LENGTH=1041 /DNA_ID=CAMNT_0005306729 /DNA_START=76 /DNA_END=3201 /DNA_ORIENTATION=-